MASPEKQLLPRFLHWLAQAVFSHRRLFFYPQIVLVLICSIYTWLNLEFHTNRNDLVGGEKQYHRIYLDFRKEFPVQDDLVVVVESENLEKNRQFIERLGAKVEAETTLFTNIFYKADLNALGPKALLFLPESGLRDLEQTLRNFLPMLKQFAAATNLVSLFDLVNTQFRTANPEANADNLALVKAMPALERILALAGDGIGRSGNPPSPGLYSLFEGGKDATKQVYVTFDDGRIFLLTAQAARDEVEGDAVRKLMTLMHQTQSEVPGINVGLTGEPVLEVDEMDQSKQDTSLASIVSIVTCTLIFIYGYHETGRPLKATACLLVGLAYTLGFTTLVVGHLNILTITFVPILVGLAIDFGVHLITRYEEELWRGRTELMALEKALVQTGKGIFTGALTTAGAFFAMALTDFDGIQEMGVICGGGMMICLVPMMTMLPVMLLRGRQNVLDHKMGEVLDDRASHELDRRARLEKIWLHRPFIVASIIVVLTCLAYVGSRSVKFDYNLLNMQSEGLPAVIFQDRLIATSPKSVLYAAVVADSAVQATNLASVLTNLTTVSSVDSLSGILTEDQSEKLKLLRDIKQIVNEVLFQPLDTNPVNITAMLATLGSLHGYLGLAIREVDVKTHPEPHAYLVSLQTTVGQLNRQLRIGESENASLKLAAYQQALFNDVRETFEAIKAQDDRGPMAVEDLPSALRDRFIGITGKHLLQVFPKENIWNREAQERFVKELRKVQENVTGTPVQLFEYTTLLKDSYETAALYSLGAIILMIFVHFRSVASVILSLLPVGVGCIWTVGLMGFAGTSFNPANIIMWPLIIGIGVTNGIHILNRYAEELHPSILARSTGKAVLVSGLTTIAGFGSLMLAKHRGIESLGFVMATGVASCMVVALTFLPVILNLLEKCGWRIKKPSVTMHNQHWVGRNRGNTSISG